MNNYFMTSGDIEDGRTEKVPYALDSASHLKKAKHCRGTTRIYEPSFIWITTSIRLFKARPSTVSLLAIGTEGP